MEERAVTVDGNGCQLPEPFIVIATQNPVEQQGVFPLPEAQLDRFLIKIELGYPSFQDEIRIVESQEMTHPIHGLNPVAGMEDLRVLRSAAKNIHMDPSISEYVVRIIMGDPDKGRVKPGSQPEGLDRPPTGCRGRWPLIAGSSYVLPDHVQAVAPRVLLHRILLTPQARLAEVSADEVARPIIQTVDTSVYHESG
jgi:MoxR-like ATPase